MSFESKFRNIVGRANQLEKPELVILLRELLNQLNEEKKIQIEGWKGKSSFDYRFIGDKLIVTKFQKPEKGAEPKEVRYEIDSNEFNQIKSMILYIFDKEGIESIKSTEIAEQYYNRSWKEIFNDRKVHNRFTIILNVLDKQKILEYRGGKVYAIQERM